MKLLNMILLLSVPFLSFSQLDVVHLKNNSEIRGFILKKNDSIVKIRTKDGSIWVFNKSEVVDTKLYKQPVTKSGYYFSISGTALLGISTSGSFNIINGYSINKHWDFGLGIGYESIYYSKYIPVFLESRYNLLKKPTTPFVDIKIGYDISLDNNRNYGGIIGSSSVGIKHQFSKHLSVFNSVGYRYSRLREKLNWWGFEEQGVGIREINRFELRFGFIFK